MYNLGCTTPEDLGDPTAVCITGTVEAVPLDAAARKLSSLTHGIRLAALSHRVC